MKKKKVFKSILNFILNIFLALLTIILSIVLVLFIVRNSSSKLFNEKEIKKIIDNINILDLVKDKDGNDIGPVKEIKDKLVNVGVPDAAIEGFINSSPIKEVVSDITEDAIDIIIYDDKFEFERYSSNDISEFFHENISIIVSEMQKNNVPRSDELTKERQEKILNKMDEELPVLVDKVNMLTEEATDKLETVIDQLKNSAAYGSFNNILNLLRTFFSKKVTYLFLGFIILGLLLIGIIKHKHFEFLTWYSFISLLTSMMLFIIKVLMLKTKSMLIDLPEIFRDLYINISKIVSNSLLIYFVIFFVIGILLIIIRSLIKCYQIKKQES